MGELFISAVAKRRRDTAMAFLARRRRAEPLTILAGVREGGVALLRAHTREAGALYGWEVLQLAPLAQRLALPALAKAGRAPCTPLVRQALCARVLATQQARGRLGRFAAVANKPGFPGALAQTLHELSMEGVGVARVADADPDLAQLLEAYRGALRDADLIDGAELYGLATEALSGRKRLPPLLALDLPLRHRLEGQLLTALMERSEASLCILPAGDARARRWLEEAAKPPGRPQEASLFDSALQRLQHHLFQEHAPSGERDAAVHVLSAPGEARECVELARHILWAAEAGTPFDRMAVLPRRSSAYRDYLSEALGRAGIPVRFSREGSRPDPAGRALLSLLACRAEGLSARRFAEYLSLHEVPAAPSSASPPTGPETQGEPAERPFAPPEGLFHPPPDDDQEQIDEPDARAPDAEATIVNGVLRRPSRWEQLLVDAAVIGGAERWRRRLDGLEERLRLAAHERARQGEDPTALERQRQDLQHLREFALPVLEQLAALPEEATWGVWLSQLAQLAQTTLRRPSRVLSLLAELSPMAERGPVSLSEVQWALRAPLSELVATQDEDTSGKVFVGDAEDARGMTFDLVCVPGLAEKIFPERLREDPLLLDETRRAISDDLITNRDRAAQERLCLRIAIGAAAHQVVLSYPRIDLERVRPRVPSFYGLEVLRASEGRLPGYDELMARAERAVESRIGWPAPRDARDAIDAAEHDLAVLESPLVRGHATPTGHARYLLHVNPHLARALRFRARRWAVAKFCSADGLVDPGPEVLAVLAAHRPAQRPYSPTALQTFAVCPYRFYLHAVLGLRARDMPEPIERLSPLERGALFHAVQSRTLVALREAQALPVTHENLSAALARMDETLRATADRYRERLAPAIDRIWQDGIDELRSDLRQWLMRLADNAAWVPLHFELGFGLSPSPDDDERDPESRSAPAHLPGAGMLLRGAIDLVEQRDGRLRATDHKTGRCDLPEELRIGGGQALQPGLYGLALRAMFPERQVDAGRLYYCTARGGFEERTVPIDEALEGAVADFTRTLDTALREGFLPAAPDGDACEACDYRAICGPYEAQRVKRKRPERLAPLTALRKRP